MLRLGLKQIRQTNISLLRETLKDNDIKSTHLVAVKLGVQHMLYFNLKSIPLCLTMLPCNTKKGL